jgi:hypothetical protein
VRFTYHHHVAPGFVWRKIAFRLQARLVRGSMKFVRHDQFHRVSIQHATLENAHRTRNSNQLVTNPHHHDVVSPILHVKTTEGFSTQKIFGNDAANGNADIILHVS